MFFECVHSIRMFQVISNFSTNFSVKVQKILPNDGFVEVQKWDSGDVDHMSINILRPLHQSYRQIHQMVFCARLHGKATF